MGVARRDWWDWCGLATVCDEWGVVRDVWEVGEVLEVGGGWTVHNVYFTKDPQIYIYWVRHSSTHQLFKLK